MKTFCTCPPSGNQVDGLPLVLHQLMTHREIISVGVTRMLCQQIGFGRVERANVKPTKKCMRLM